MNRSLLAGVLLGAGGAGAALLVHRSTDRTPPAPPAAPAREVDGAAIEHELSALRREVAELREARQTPAAASAARAAPPPREPRALTPEDRERMRADHEAKVQALASRMRAEPRDASWSRATEQSFSEGFSARQTPGARFLSVECRATMCAATFQHDHDDPMTRNEVAHIVGPSLSGSGQAMYSYSNDGTPQTTVYISREGHRLDER